MKLKIEYLLYICLFVLTISCNKKTNIYDLLECKPSTNYKHLKTIRDVKNNFEINIGKNWKRELYFDDYQSRIYTADTTKSYLSSFIIDITRFKGKIIIEDAFKEHLVSAIQKKPKNYIIKEGFIDFGDKKSYCAFSFEKQKDLQVYTIETYVPDGEYYYLLTSTINGSDHLAESVLESLEVFNSLKQLP